MYNICYDFNDCKHTYHDGKHAVIIVFGTKFLFFTTFALLPVS